MVVCKVYLLLKTHQCVFPDNTTHLMFTDEDSKDRPGTHICCRIRQHGQCVLIPLDHGADYTVPGSRQGLSTATFLGSGCSLVFIPTLALKILFDTLCCV